MKIKKILVCCSSDKELNIIEHYFMKLWRDNDELYKLVATNNTCDALNRLLENGFDLVIISDKLKVSNDIYLSDLVSTVYTVGKFGIFLTHWRRLLVHRIKRQLGTLFNHFQDYFEIVTMKELSIDKLDETVKKLELAMTPEVRANRFNELWQELEKQKHSIFYRWKFLSIF